MRKIRRDRIKRKLEFLYHHGRPISSKIIRQKRKEKRLSKYENGGKFTWYLAGSSSISNFCMRQNDPGNLKQRNRTFLIRITRVQNEIRVRNGIRNDGQSEMNPLSTFFHSNFDASFAFPLPLLPPPPFSFLLFSTGEKRSCSREMRELAFRATYWCLFSRRRKYSALFSFTFFPLNLFGFVRYAWFVDWI